VSAQPSLTESYLSDSKRPHFGQDETGQQQGRSVVARSSSSSVGSSDDGGGLSGATKKSPGGVQAQLKQHVDRIQAAVLELDEQLSFVKNIDLEILQAEAERIESINRSTLMRANSTTAKVISARPKKTILIDRPDDTEAQSEGSDEVQAHEDEDDVAASGDSESDEETVSTAHRKSKKLAEEAMMQAWKMDAAYDTLQDLLHKVNVEERVEILEDVSASYRSNQLNTEMASKFLTRRESDHADMIEGSVEGGDVSEELDLRDLRVMKLMRRYQDKVRSNIWGSEAAMEKEALEEERRVQKLKSAMLALSHSDEKITNPLLVAAALPLATVSDVLKVLSSYCEEIEDIRARHELDKARKLSYAHALEFMKSIDQDMLQDGADFIGICKTDLVTGKAINEIYTWLQGGEDGTLDELKEQEGQAWRTTMALQQETAKMKLEIIKERNLALRHEAKGELDVALIEDLPIPVVDATSHAALFEYQSWRNYELFSKEATEVYKRELQEIKATTEDMQKQMVHFKDIGEMAESVTPALAEATKVFMVQVNNAARNLKFGSIPPDDDEDVALLTHLQEKNGAMNRRHQEQFDVKIKALKDKEMQLRMQIRAESRDCAATTALIEEQTHIQDDLETQIRVARGEENLSPTGRKLRKPRPNGTRKQRMSKKDRKKGKSSPTSLTSVLKGCLAVQDMGSAEEGGDADGPPSAKADGGRGGGEGVEEDEEEEDEEWEDEAEEEEEEEEERELDEVVEEEETRADDLHDESAQGGIAPFSASSTEGGRAGSLRTNSGRSMPAGRSALASDGSTPAGRNSLGGSGRSTPAGLGPSGSGRGTPDEEGGRLASRRSLPRNTSAAATASTLKSALASRGGGIGDVFSRLMKGGALASTAAGGAPRFGASRLVGAFAAKLRKLTDEASQQQEEAKALHNRTARLIEQTTNWEEALAQVRRTSPLAVRGCVRKAAKDSLPPGLGVVRHQAQAFKGVQQDMKQDWSEIRRIMRKGRSYKHVVDADQVNRDIIAICNSALKKVGIGADVTMQQLQEMVGVHSPESAGADDPSGAALSALISAYLFGGRDSGGEPSVSLADVAADDDDGGNQMLHALTEHDEEEEA